MTKFAYSISIMGSRMLSFYSLARIFKIARDVIEMIVRH